MLCPALKKSLKIKAHALKPVILIGQHGLSATLLKELNLALAHHELIKVKLPESLRDERAALTEAILEQSQAHLVQSMGRIITLYKEKEDDVPPPSTSTSQKNKGAAKPGTRNKARKI